MLRRERDRMASKDSDERGTPTWLIREFYKALAVARDDLEDDLRVRKPFKDRFVRGSLDPDQKVICADCGDIHDAMEIDCPDVVELR